MWKFVDSLRFWDSLNSNIYEKMIKNLGPIVQGLHV
jgi:hypothetical protein